MTKREFLKLTKKAAETKEVDMAEAQQLMNIWMNKRRVAVSELGAVSFIIWNCRNRFGEWNHEELAKTQRAFRRVDLIKREARK